MQKDRQRTTAAGAAAAATRVHDLADAIAAAAPNVNEHERRVAVSLLAIPEMDHRFYAEGGKPIYGWCALDPFLIVPVIGRAAHVESRDATTGEPITMTVTPDDVEDLSPPSGVVSFLVPDQPFDQDVIQSFCHFVLTFASRDSADRWASERDGIVLLPVADAFQVGRRAWRWLREPTSTAR